MGAGHISSPNTLKAAFDGEWHNLAAPFHEGQHRRVRARPADLTADTLHGRAALFSSDPTSATSGDEAAPASQKEAL